MCKNIKNTFSTFTCTKHFLMMAWQFECLNDKLVIIITSENLSAIQLKPIATSARKTRAFWKGPKSLCALPTRVRQWKLKQNKPRNLTGDCILFYYSHQASNLPAIGWQCVMRVYICSGHVIPVSQHFFSYQYQSE